MSHLVESLERRSLLSSTLAGGALTVSGSKFFDDVIISRDSQNAAIQVVSEKRKGLAPVLTKFNFADVKSISVSLGAGDDAFIIDDTYGLINQPRVINGDDGADRISGGRLDDVINGGAGNDILSGRQGNDNVSGGDGDDVISGGTGNDTLAGQNGNDTVYGDDGNDIQRGGTGNDYVHGTNGNDTLYGDDGNDSIEGCSGNDLLYGGTGNDIIDGLDGSDILYGEAGNDILSGNLEADEDAADATTNDQLFGGDGNDDFDPLDRAGEVKDRVAADSGRNSTTVSIQAAQDIVDSRNFA